jgi:hypothetical protein
LEKLSLFANDGKRDKHYLVAESFICTDEEVDILQEHQRLGTLSQYLYFLSTDRTDSVLKNLANGDEARLTALIARNPLFDENNVAYQIYSSSNENRVLVIYNARRLADFIEKKQLNPNASGENGLLHKPEALSFHVDPSCKEPWMTRLQDSC